MTKGLLLCLLGVAPACAELKFDATLKEVEASVNDNRVTVDFSFRNEGDKPLSIKRYDATCTCSEATVKNSKLDYAPGETGVIRAVFDMSNFSGTVDKPVYLWLDGDPEDKPSVILTARIHIPVLVEIEPKTVTWDLGENATSKTIVLTVKHSKPIHVKEVSGSNPLFSHELRTVEEGKKYEIEITPNSTKEVGIGVFHIDTDCDIPRHRTQRVFSVVRRPASTAATPAP